MTVSISGATISGGVTIGDYVSIVTSGLVLNLDAGYPASYPGSGTTWTDLSGNGNNGTLINGVGFSSANDGSLVFDGVDDYVSVSGSRTLTEATFSVWLKRNGNQVNFAGILFSRGTSVTGLNFYSTTNNLGYHWNDAALSYDFNSGLTTPDGVWCMCALTVTSTTATFYLCQSSGITTATNTVAHASTTLDALAIGRDAAGARYVNGSIAQASLYNRALSATEITQNFNALRGRYGI